jgi:NAD+ synthase (glutamine-hydrolysing)
MTDYFSHSARNPASEISQIAAALTVGLRDFMKNIGQKNIVIGLSGGIDSAVVATLAVLAVGRENVTAINMPSEFNSETTKGFAKRLADQLGIRYEIMPIQASVEYTRSQIEQTLGVSADGLVSENIQARDRGSRVLAGVAASLGAVFTNNGNKTEVSQGYATLYGDVNGSVAPIADLYKTQVFALARFLAEKHGLPVLAEICDIPPSAELSADQSIDEGKGDPFVFEYHDKLIYQFVEGRRDPADILVALRDGKLERTLGTAKPVIGPEGYFPTVRAFVADVERIWKNYKLSYFKRIQAPPILTVSRRSFGYDLEESQN